jgi:hypothetical protein
MAKDITVALELDNKQFNNALKQSTKEVDKFSKESQSDLAGLKSAFAGLVTAATLKSIVDVGANFQDLQNSLNIVFGGLEQGAAAFQRVEGFAASTQFSVQQLTQAFVQLKGAGVEPTEELLQTFADTSSVVTDQMGAFQAMLDLVSRSTAGGLGLEDLNRLADRGIPVFTILQERLGLARLEVSEFGKSADGANTIIKELLAGLQEDFGGALTSQIGNINFELNQLGDAFDKLQNALFKTFSSDAASAIQGLTDAINRLADNSDAIATFGKALGGLILTLGAFKLVKGITGLMNAFQSRLTSLFTKMGDGRTKVKGLKEAFRGLFLQSKGSKFDDVTKGLTGINKTTAEATKKIFTFSGGLATLGKTLLRFAGGIGIAFTAFQTFKFLFELIRGPVDDASDAIKDNAHVLEYQAEQARIAAEAAAALAEKTKLAKDEAEAFKRGYDNAAKSVVKFKKEAIDSNDPLANYMAFFVDLTRAAKDMTMEQDNAQRAMRVIRQMMEDKAPLFTEEEYIFILERLNEILGITNEATKEQVAAFEAFKSAMDLLFPSTENLAFLQERLNTLFTEGKITAEQFDEALENLNNTAAENEGLNSFIDTLGKAQVALSDDLANAFVEGEKAGDAFKDFFKKMVKQIIADIIRLSIIQPILGALLAPFGFGFGGGGNIIKLPGLAEGGPAKANSPYIVGEKGPELFVPNSSGTVIPNDQLGQGMNASSGPVTNNYITNNIQALDSKSVAQVFAENRESLLGTVEYARKETAYGV